MADDINNLLLPVRRILVLPDEGSSDTGVIFRTSTMGGGSFISADVQSQEVPVLHTHVLFVESMSTEVTIDGVEYRAMHMDAVVGLIP